MKALLLTDHATYLRRTFELARLAVENGNHPFGALLVHEGKVLLEFENTVNTERDPTRHAELSLISRASQLFPLATLERSTLYSSTEPCPMCAGAAYWAGIRHVVFGCSSRALGRIAGEAFTVDIHDLFRNSHDRMNIEGPLDEEEAIIAHKNYWPRA